MSDPQGQERQREAVKSVPSKADAPAMVSLAAHHDWLLWPAVGLLAALVVLMTLKTAGNKFTWDVELHMLKVRALALRRQYLMRLRERRETGGTNRVAPLVKSPAGPSPEPASDVDVIEEVQTQAAV